MPKKRNSNKKSNQNIQDIGCPHVHTHTLTQFGSNVWFNCLMIFYSDCEYRKIEDNKEATQCIKILQTYLDDIKVTAQANRFHIQFKTFFDDLSVFFSELDSLRKRLSTAIQQNKNEEFSSVKSESLKLKQRLDSSQVMSIYAKHRAHLLLERRVNGISEVENSSSSKKSKLNEKMNNCELEVLSNSKEESKENPKEDYIILMENYAEKYKDLELKVQQLEEANREFKSKIQIENDSKMQTEEKYIRLKTEIEILSKTHIEDEEKFDKLQEGINIDNLYTY